MLLGENGNGKTTLVKLITGELEATEGECLRSPHVRVALVNQHHADQIDLRLTPLQFMLSQFPGDGSNAARGAGTLFGARSFPAASESGKAWSMCVEVLVQPMTYR